MNRDIVIDARWDGEAAVWLATSDQVPGLLVEAGTWSAMIADVQLALPDLLDVAAAPDHRLSLTFRAEEHLDFVPA